GAPARSSPSRMPICGRGSTLPRRGTTCAGTGCAVTPATPRTSAPTSWRAPASPARRAGSGEACGLPAARSVGSALRLGGLGQIMLALGAERLAFLAMKPLGVRLLGAFERCRAAGSRRLGGALSDCGGTKRRDSCRGGEKHESVHDDLRC